MYYYSYSEFLEDLKSLRFLIEKKIGVPDAIICIARGGMTMSHMLALAWDLRSVYTLNAISYDDTRKQSSLTIENMPSIKPKHQKILIVDEIVDSGKSLETIMKKFCDCNPDKLFYSATIFQKLTASICADFYLKEPHDWIDFFWEVDMFKEKGSVE